MVGEVRETDFGLGLGILPLKHASLIFCLFFGDSFNFEHCTHASPLPIPNNLLQETWTCPSLFRSVFSVRVSQPYSKTGITSDLKILIFVRLHRYWQPTDHGLASSFKRLRTYVTNASCLSTPQPCHSLFDFINRGCSFVNGQISIHHLQHSGLKLSAWRVNLEQLLKMLSPTSHLPIHVWHEATICCLDSTHLRCRLGAELLQGSICRLEVISI